jgi:glycerophosphoryl diester phosphodiesterase
MIPIIAHRTCPLHAPENSIEGIRRAAELGADGVEIDVRPSLDGVPMLMHDWSTRRTMGLPGPIRLFPRILLQRFRLRGGKEPPPTLDEALDTLPEPLFIAIEVKDARAAAGCLRAVRARNLESRVLFWSYRERAVRYFSEEAPEIETSLLRDPVDPEGLSLFLSDATAFGARGISAHWEAINRQFVGEAHSRKLRVYSWIRELDLVERKVATGMDGIVTNEPKEVREILDRTSAKGG